VLSVISRKNGIPVRCSESAGQLSADNPARQRQNRCPRAPDFLGVPWRPRRFPHPGHLRVNPGVPGGSPRSHISRRNVDFCATCRRRKASIYRSAAAPGGGCPRQSSITKCTNPMNRMGILWSPFGTVSSLKCQARQAQVETPDFKLGRRPLMPNEANFTRSQASAGRQICETNPIPKGQVSSSKSQMSSRRDWTGYALTSNSPPPRAGLRAKRTQFASRRNGRNRCGGNDLESDICNMGLQKRSQFGEEFQVWSITRQEGQASGHAFTLHTLHSAGGKLASFGTGSAEPLRPRRGKNWLRFARSAPCFLSCETKPVFGSRTNGGGAWGVPGKRLRIPCLGPT
jgi:hypothetical protein